jgi:hypothetical protein
VSFPSSTSAAVTDLAGFPDGLPHSILGNGAIRVLASPEPMNVISRVELGSKRQCCIAEAHEPRA